MKPGVVLDCMVWVQAIASQGTAHRCLKRISQENLPLLTCQTTLDELRSVLNRPELRRKLPGLTTVRVNALLGHLEHWALVLEEIPRQVEFPDDPKDEIYLNLSLAGRARDLVTRDSAMLGTMRPTHPLHQALVGAGLTVQSPEEFLDSEPAPFPLPNS